MENEIQLDLFGCKERFYDENNSWSLNYQSLPIIMSGLKMDSIPSASTSTSITFQSETVFSTASTASDSERRNSPVSSCSDDENESEIYSKTGNEHESPFKSKFRELRSRTSESIMRINHKTITKPKKLTKEIKLTPSAIKKLYMESGKKLGRFKPSNLETIFEEPLGINADEEGSLGKRKLKRSLSCSDGLNITKATLKNRRQKIKRIFGKRFALKKINLAEFKEKLNSSMEEWEDFHENSGNP